MTSIYYNSSVNRKWASGNLSGDDTIAFIRPLDEGVDATINMIMEDLWNAFDGFERVPEDDEARSYILGTLEYMYKDAITSMPPVFEVEINTVSGKTFKAYGNITDATISSMLDVVIDEETGDIMHNPPIEVCTFD